MKLLSKTVEQKSSILGFPKPGEFIEMTGTHMLEASDRVSTITLSDGALVTEFDGLPASAS